MTEEEWKTLETTTNGEIYNKLLWKTREEEEHPEWYNGPCACALCRMYADIEE